MGWTSSERNKLLTKERVEILKCKSTISMFGIFLMFVHENKFPI